MNEVPFQQEEEDEEEPLEPLRMEHFYLPLVLLMGGLVLSTISFIVEIIIKLRQSVIIRPYDFMNFILVRHIVWLSHVYRNRFSLDSELRVVVVLLSRYIFHIYHLLIYTYILNGNWTELVDYQLSSVKLIVWVVKVFSNMRAVMLLCNSLLSFQGSVLLIFVDSSLNLMSVVLASRLNTVLQVKIVKCMTI